MFRWLCVVVALFGMMAFAACGGEEQAPPTTPGDQIEEAAEGLEEAAEGLEEAAEEMAEEAEGSAERMEPAEKEGPAE